MKTTTKTGARRTTYRLIIDPGHGWLKVPYADVIAAGVADDISQYSYDDGAHVYLEEDCDLPLFMRARGWQSWRDMAAAVNIVEKQTNGPAQCRGFPRWKGGG